MQGTDDFLELAVQGIASLSAGILISGDGWTSLNSYAIPVVAMTTLASALLWLYRRSARGREISTTGKASVVEFLVALLRLYLHQRPGRLLTNQVGH